MSQATHGHTASAVCSATPSRRSLFGAGAALLLLAPVAAGSVKAAEIDGELLCQCAAFQAADREAKALDLEALDPGCTADDRALQARLDAIMDRWTATLDAVAALPARTPEGIAAKAAVLRGSITTMIDDFDPNDRLALSLVNDIAGRV